MVLRHLATLACLALLAVPVTAHAQAPVEDDIAPGLQVLWPPDLSVVPDDQVLVLGRAAPGADVVRGCGFLCEQHATADEHGRWQMTVDELPYEETFAFELWSGDDRLVHHVRHEVVEDLAQIPLPLIAGPDGVPVPELGVVDARAVPHQTFLKGWANPWDWGIQVVITIRNNSPGPIRLLPFWQRSGFAVHAASRGRPDRVLQGTLWPFPEVLAPGAIGYLLGETEVEEERLPRGLRLSLETELLYAYIDPVEGLEATVTSTRLHPIEAGGWYVTGGLEGGLSGPHYAVAVLGLDREGRPTGFAIDDRTRDGGWTRSSPDAESPPRFRACCLRGHRPASVVGLAQRIFDDAYPWWPEEPAESPAG